MTIIPAINAKTFEEARAQFLKIMDIFSGLEEKGEHWIHLDVVDGKFAPNTTWGSPEEFKALIAGHLSPVASLNFEIHLMVENPEFVVRQWLEAGAKRIIVHVEAMHDSEIITDACKECGAEAVLAANPETPVEELLLHEDEFNAFQILAVPPGEAGQKIQLGVIEKMRALRTKMPRATLEWDGGANSEIADLMREIGVNMLVSASYIVGSDDPKRAYAELKQA